jgi:hypothetical protein
VFEQPREHVRTRQLPPEKRVLSVIDHTEASRYQFARAYNLSKTAAGGAGELPKVGLRGFVSFVSFVRGV